MYMFVHTQLKPGPTARFMARLNGFCAWLAAPPTMSDMPLDDVATDWYSGLCVDPRDFSKQLGKLQNSLRATNYPVSATPCVSNGKLVNRS
jgi:hypothetical protein